MDWRRVVMTDVGEPRLSAERLEKAQAKLPSAKLGIEGNAWLNSYADDLLHDLKLERERVERLERERANLDKLYWGCAIDFARLRDFNEATKAAWNALSAASTQEDE